MNLRDSISPAAAESMAQAWYRTRNPRPVWESPEAFAAQHIDDRSRGFEPWRPETAEELLALNDLAPEVARFYRPPSPHDRHMGLPPWFGKPVEPWNEFERKEFLKTLETNKTFARAVWVLLNEAACDE